MGDVVDLGAERRRRRGVHAPVEGIQGQSTTFIIIDDITAPSWLHWDEVKATIDAETRRRCADWERQFLYGQQVTGPPVGKGTP